MAPPEKEYLGYTWFGRRIGDSDQAVILGNKGYEGHPWFERSGGLDAQARRSSQRDEGSIAGSAGTLTGLIKLCCGE